MKVCLIAPGPSSAGATGHDPCLLAQLLAQRHQVTVVHSGYEDRFPDPFPDAGFAEVQAVLTEDLRPLKFACDDHRHSAQVLEAIRRHYGGEGPDYLEVPDFRAHGLMPLQARRGGEPLLAETTIAVRISPSSELLSLHDGALRRAGNERLAELEREQLRLADELLWLGGDWLDLYRRYYRDLRLPPATKIAAPFPPPPTEPVEGAAGGGEPGPLRLLYCGDLRRSQGVVDLVEACWTLPPESWSLTLVGDDSPTATMGQSVRATVEAMSGEDPRIEILEDSGPEAFAAQLRSADLFVSPARLEASPRAALAAMGAGVPVLATPVGSLVEEVEDGVAGWLAADVGGAAVGRALRRLEADRGELERVRASVGLRRRAREIADPEPTLAAYDKLLATPRRPAPVSVAAEPPLVTGVIPYYRAPEYVAEAVASLLAQTHPRLEVLIVNDGSFESADAVLDELSADPRVRVVTQVNRGEGAARTLGARVATGEYVVLLDADNAFEPTFVERALAVLRREPDLAYVTCWLRMVDAEGADTELHPSFAPLGNSVLSSDSENWDGDTLALLPRTVFTELGFEFPPEGSMHSDWELYRWMRSRGVYGAVIPERLAHYRVLPDSLMRSYSDGLQLRGWDESRERIVLRETRWTAEVPA